jgi:diguanylate cyclase (GGDEF)-like protein
VAASRTGEGVSEQTGDSSPVARAAPARTAAQQALHRLLGLPDVDYQQLLAVPADYARTALRADSVSLSRWERDRGVVRTLVNDGAVAPDEQRFPSEEVHEIAHDPVSAHVLRGDPAVYRLGDPDLGAPQRAQLERTNKRSALSIPVRLEGRLWGELWATRSDASFCADDLPLAMGVADDVAGMVAVAERLYRMATLALQDPLTGLANRRVLDEMLADRLVAGGSGATIVLCDLDDLKVINDDLGHAEGDRALVSTADALAAASGLEPGSVAVRLGGDEFVVVLTGACRGAAIALVEQTARVLSAHEPPIGISCGVVEIPAGTSPQAALAAADVAQYAAKARRALFVVSSEVGGGPPGAPGLPAGAGSLVGGPPPGPRRADRRRVQNASAQAALVVLRQLAERAPTAPDLGRARLRWLAELLLTPFDLEHWSLSRADLAGERSLRTNSMGLRLTHDPTTRVLHVDTVFPLADYPTSARAIEAEQWFVVRDDGDPGAQLQAVVDPAVVDRAVVDPAVVDRAVVDQAELDLLRDMGMRYVVALGCHDGDAGWLLELYGRSTAIDPSALAAVVATGAGLLLGRPFGPLGQPADVPG